MATRIGWICFLALVPSVLATGTPVTAFAQSFSLSGPDWYIHEDASGKGASPKLYTADTAEGSWIPARVPGNIQADLEAAHRLDPLWYGAGDPRLAAVAEKDWWYRKDFTLPESFLEKRLVLIFDGVDFECEVWLNGRRLGAHAGQFARFEFDVSQIARPGGKNHLAVKIKRMPEELGRCLRASDGALSGLGTPDWFINCYNYTRQTLKDLKSGSNYSYDWGVNIYTLGIWRDAWLEASGPARIERVQVQTELTDNYQKAIIKPRLELDSQSAVKVRAIFRVHGHGVDKTVVAEAPLEEGGNIVGAQLAVEKPALWWPNGQGEQPLYELEAQLKDVVSGAELDHKSARFGVREVRWQQVEGAPPNFINPYRLVVNGRPVRMLGSDMTSTDLLFGRNPGRGARYLWLAKAAGMNTLRLHGAGVTFPPDYYDKADELGIMLSQEFPLANCRPEADPVFVANLDVTIRSIVKELRNHASIIEWVGGNEMSWEQGTDHPALHVLERVCAQEDDRIFRATDPIQGSKHSPWLFLPTRYYDHFNHVWEPKPDSPPDFSVNTMNAMRYGEFGTQSPANLELFQREIPPSSQWPLGNPLDPVLIRKNVLQAAFTPLDWLVKPVIEGFFGPLGGLPELIEAGQYVGAEGLRYSFDELRRKGKHIGGITNWDYNEPWPNGAGSYMVDYDGQPLMNYDFVREALSPISLTLRYSSNLYDPKIGLDLGLWLVSDSPGPASGLKWNWTARDRRGRVIARETGRASIQPQEVRELGRVKVKPLPETALGPILVELRLDDGTGKTLAERVHIFGADNAPIWPFDGLLRNKGSDRDDNALLAATPQGVRVLWLQDWNDGRYEDLAWYLRRFGIRSTHVAATPKAFAEVAPDAAALAKNYDVVWLGEADFRSMELLGKRLGANNLTKLVDAVHAGLGLGLEGGWGGFGDAGLTRTPLADILPVTFVGVGNDQRGGLSSVEISDATSALVAGGLASSFPQVTNYNIVKAKQGANVVLKTSGGDPLLLTVPWGKGRVLAYTSGIVGDWDYYEGKSVDWGWNLRAWSGSSFFVARMLTWLAGASDADVAAIGLPTEANRVTRPVRRTTLQVSPHPLRIESSNEILTFELKNAGEMTALFCTPHPVLEYRTDLMVLNNHISIPPGETRAMIISGPAQPQGGLTLAQTGWRVSCWNADDIMIPPSEDVLLSFGRRDAMTMEYAGYRGDPTQVLGQDKPSLLELAGKRPDSSQIPMLMPGPLNLALAKLQPHSLGFTVGVTPQQATRPSRLRINTADQDNVQGPVVEAIINGKGLAKALPLGLGRQLTDPAHLAFPATAEFELPAGTWKTGKNSLQIRVKDGGWFTWDSLDLVVMPAAK